METKLTLPVLELTTDDSHIDNTSVNEEKTAVTVKFIADQNSLPVLVTLTSDTLRDLWFSLNPNPKYTYSIKNLTVTPNAVAVGGNVVLRADFFKKAEVGAEMPCNCMVSVYRMWKESEDVYKYMNVLRISDVTSISSYIKMREKDSILFVAMADGRIPTVEDNDASDYVDVIVSSNMEYYIKNVRPDPIVGAAGDTLVLRASFFSKYGELDYEPVKSNVRVYRVDNSGFTSVVNKTGVYSISSKIIPTRSTTYYKIDITVDGSDPSTGNVVASYTVPVNIDTQKVFYSIEDVSPLSATVDQGDDIPVCAKFYQTTRNEEKSLCTCNAIIGCWLSDGRTPVWKQFNSVSSIDTIMEDIDKYCTGISIYMAEGRVPTISDYDADYTIPVAIDKSDLYEYSVSLSDDTIDTHVGDVITFSANFIKYIPGERDSLPVVCNASVYKRTEDTETIVGEMYEDVASISVGDIVEAGVTEYVVYITTDGSEPSASNNVANSIVVIHSMDKEYIYSIKSFKSSANKVYEGDSVVLSANFTRKEKEGTDEEVAYCDAELKVINSQYGPQPLKTYSNVSYISDTFAVDKSSTFVLYLYEANSSGGEREYVAYDTLRVETKINDSNYTYYIRNVSPSSISGDTLDLINISADFTRKASDSDVEEPAQCYYALYYLNDNDDWVPYYKGNNASSCNIPLRLYSGMKDMCICISTSSDPNINNCLAMSTIPIYITTAYITLKVSDDTPEVGSTVVVSGNFWKEKSYGDRMLRENWKGYYVLYEEKGNYGIVELTRSFGKSFSYNHVVMSSTVGYRLYVSDDEGVSSNSYKVKDTVSVEVHGEALEYKYSVVPDESSITAKAGDIVTLGARFYKTPKNGGDTVPATCNVTIYKKILVSGAEYNIISYTAVDSVSYDVEITEDTAGFEFFAAIDGTASLMNAVASGLVDIVLQEEPSAELGNFRYKVGIIPDIHIAEDDNSWWDEADFIAAMNIFADDADVKFIASMGDIAEAGAPHLGSPDNDYATFNTIYEGDDIDIGQHYYWQSKGLRFFSALGNHDFYGLFESRSGDTIMGGLFKNSTSIDGYNASVRDRIGNLWITGSGVNQILGVGRILFELEHGKDIAVDQADMNFFGYNAFIDMYAEAAGYTGEIMPSENRISEEAIAVTTNYVNNNWDSCKDTLSGWNIGSCYGRNNYSKLNYWLKKDDDIFIFLSVDYGDDVWGVTSEWHDRMIHARTIIDTSSNDPYIKRMVEYVSDTGYSSNDAPYNYQYYSPNTLIWLKEILENNQDCKIYIFSHHFLTHKAGNSNGVPINGAYMYSEIAKDGVLETKEAGVTYNKGSNALSGIEFWFLNKLNSTYKNAVWFSGHSHISWEVDGHFINHDYNIVSPAEQNEYVYTRASDTPAGSAGYTVALPSLSKPRYINESGESERRYEDAELSVMEIYDNGIKIKGYKLKQNNVNVYDANNPMVEETIILRNS